MIGEHCAHGSIALIQIDTSISSSVQRSAAHTASIWGRRGGVILSYIACAVPGGVLLRLTVGQGRSIDGTLSKSYTRLGN